MANPNTTQAQASAKPTCSTPECGKEAKVKGKCQTCYHRAWRARNHNPGRAANKPKSKRPYSDVTGDPSPYWLVRRHTRAIKIHKLMLASGDTIPGFDHERAIRKLEAEIADFLANQRR
jgi:hypothetical protein